MLKLKRRTAWAVPMMLQAALMSAGPLFGSEQTSDEQVVQESTIEAEVVAVSSEEADEDGDEAEARPNPPALKTRTVKGRPTKTAPAEVQEVVVRGKDGAVGTYTGTSTGGKITVKSADGRTFEIVTPGGPPSFLLGKGKDVAPGKPVGRAITILRTADGENQVLDVDRVDGLINELTFSIKDKIANEAPKFIIGVSVSEAPDALMAQLGREEESAVVVDAVVEESPAAKAGVKKFDVILKAAGEKIGTPVELTKAVKSSDGKEVEIVLLRAGKEMTVEITPRPNEPVKFTKVHDGVIHFGPALMERRMMGMPGEGGFGPGPLHEELKALRKDVAELKKMVEELKAQK
jgi:hypothetical protein